MTRDTNIFLKAVASFPFRKFDDCRVSHRWAVIEQGVYEWVLWQWTLGWPGQDLGSMGASWRICCKCAGKMSEGTFWAWHWGLPTCESTSQNRKLLLREIYSGRQLDGIIARPRNHLSFTCRNGHQVATQNLRETETEYNENIIVECVGKEEKRRRRMSSSLPLLTPSWPSLPPNTTPLWPHVLDTSQGLVEHSDTIGRAQGYKSPVLVELLWLFS